MGSAYLLPRIVGLGRATELLILGDKIDAPARVRDRPGDRGRPRRRAAPAPPTRSRARLADGPAFAYATTKSLLTRELDIDLGSAIELEAITQALLMQSDDFAEFYNAWSEGRRPEWRGTLNEIVNARSCASRAASRTPSGPATRSTSPVRSAPGATLAQQFDDAPTT